MLKQRKKNSEIQIGHEFMGKLESMESFKFPKKQKIVDFNLDGILYKISKSGIGYLSTEEKNFLNNFSR